MAFRACGSIYQIGENEHKMADEMYDTAEQILHAAKAEMLPYERGGSIAPVQPFTNMALAAWATIRRDRR